MAGGKGKIHEHPNAGKSTFRERKQDINRTGANRKNWAKLNNHFKSLGLEKLDKQTFADLTSYLMGLNENEIKELANDKDQPLYIRLMLAELTDPNSRGKTLADWRNWLLGSAKTQTDITTNGESLSIQILNIDPLQIGTKTNE